MPVVLNTRNMASSKWAVAACAGMLLFSAVTRPAIAQDDAVEEGDEELEEMFDIDGEDSSFYDSFYEEEDLRPGYPPRNKEVKTTVTMWGGEPKAFHAGSEYEFVIGLHNTGSADVNISAVHASLNSPYDFNMWVQNFTFSVVGVVVPPGEEATVTYSITPNAQLRPADFIGAVTVYYTDMMQMYSDTVYNSTMSIIEPKGIDHELLYMLTLIICSLAGLSYVVYILVLQPKMKIGKSAPKPQVTSKSSDPADNVWLKGTAAVSSGLQGAAVKRATTPKKAKK